MLDNLSAHSEKCVFEALGALHGCRLRRRFVIHHTPNHADQLDAALYLANARTTTGIRHLHNLKSEVAACRRRAEADDRPIRWKVTVSDSRRVFRYDGIITLRTRR